ncbi:Probable intracellular septation protein A [Raoultella terrigena]|uniref:Probable intracellular septation protein A n=1 Tax=Raoultella terrigena TaxID=577 RepID=A0A4V6J0Y5_RAOTE|nr:Probable intracellular septation protein A [Raoultella terrigena]
MEGDRYLRAVRRRPAVQPVGHEKPLIQRMLGKELTLPQHVWSRLNLAWAVFSSSAGWRISTCVLAAAEYLGQLQGFGLTALTLVFTLLSGVYITAICRRMTVIDKGPSR